MTQIMFFKNLQKIGYKFFSLKRRNIKDKRIIKAFQLHYRPKNITGKIDEKTYEISQFLTK